MYEHGNFNLEAGAVDPFLVDVFKKEYPYLADSKKLRAIAHHANQDHDDISLALLFGANAAISILKEHCSKGQACPQKRILKIIEQGFESTSQETFQRVAELTAVLSTAAILMLISVHEPWVRYVFPTLALVDGLEMAVPFMGETGCGKAKIVAEILGVLIPCVAAAIGVTPELSPIVYAPFSCVLADRIYRSVFALYQQSQDAAALAGLPNKPSDVKEKQHVDLCLDNAAVLVETAQADLKIERAATSFALVGRMAFVGVLLSVFVLPQYIPVTPLLEEAATYIPGLAATALSVVAGVKVWDWWKSASAQTPVKNALQCIGISAGDNCPVIYEMAS